MEKRMQHRVSRTHPPTRQDRLVVSFLSVGIFLLLLPLARNIHPQAIGWIVMIIVIGLPVVTINVLLPFSRWEDGGCTMLHEESRHEARSKLKYGYEPASSSSAQVEPEARKLSSPGRNVTKTGTSS